MGRDVTEQRHSQAMLITALETERRAVERLRRLDAAKSEFVSTVSHELRTPVTSIIGYTELLTDGSLVKPDAAQLPLLDTIARNGERLITICNDLLLIGELESGAAEIAREEVDLVVLMKYAEASARTPRAGTGPQPELRSPRTSRPWCWATGCSSSERWTTCSAMRSSSPRTAARSRSVLEQDGSEARLVVRDTGIGIPEEEQSGLFQKFFRSSTAQAKAIQGAGLGLSIVAGIVASHGGRVGVAVRAPPRDGVHRPAPAAPGGPSGSPPGSPPR